MRLDTNFENMDGGFVMKISGRLCVLIVLLVGLLGAKGGGRGRGRGERRGIL